MPGQMRAQLREELVQPVKGTDDFSLMAAGLSRLYRDPSYSRSVQSFTWVWERPENSDGSVATPPATLDNSLIPPEPWRVVQISPGTTVRDALDNGQRFFAVF